ncbi:YjhX family toxin [Magnetovibrio sp.]|uniref:YjhX family toxin n=1 Tax=Magnetovibrio sp. TaxID=2024836 RepID=UPI002F92479C
MDISRAEQRILHLLAQGGCIKYNRNNKELSCITREGYGYGMLSLRLFQRMRYRKLIASKQGGPYRITSFGLRIVRSQPDNR